MLNAPVIAYTDSLFNIFSERHGAGGELSVVRLFFADVDAFRSMDPSSKATTTAGSTGWQVFRRVAFR
jgi:hypothetical protein